MLLGRLVHRETIAIAEKYPNSDLLREHQQLYLDISNKIQEIDNDRTNPTIPNT